MNCLWGYLIYFHSTSLKTVGSGYSNVFINLPGWAYGSGKNTTGLYEREIKNKRQQKATFFPLSASGCITSMDAKPCVYKRENTV